MKKYKSNLRIIRKKINKKDYFSVHEVDYNSKGKPTYISFHPVTLSMYDKKKDLNKELKMLQDIFTLPVLKEEDMHISDE